MRKIISGISFIGILLIFFQISAKPMVSAEWWQRPEARPTQPSKERNLLPLPTTQPTSSPSQPTAAPTSPPTPTGGAPSGGGGGAGGTTSNEDPCAAGKSYVGPYCGWSPNTTSTGGGGRSGGSLEQPRIGGGPQVLGLSNTSGSDIYLSDIMILAGILCLTLYARSKITVNKRH